MPVYSKGSPIIVNGGFLPGIGLQFHSLIPSLPFSRVAMCSKALLVLLVYGIIMHCSVYCSPAAGLQYPTLG